MHDIHGWQLNNFNQNNSTPDTLWLYSNIIHDNRAHLDNYFGFVDGITVVVSLPIKNQTIIVGNKAKGRKVTRKQSTPNFPKNEHFLPSDTHTWSKFSKKDSQSFRQTNFRRSYLSFIEFHEGIQTKKLKL